MEARASPRWPPLFLVVAVAAAAAAAIAPTSPTTAAATTAATRSTTATTTSSSSSSAGGLTRLVDHDRATAQLLTIQTGDRALRSIGGVQLHECEAARTPGLPIGNDLHLGHLTAIYNPVAKEHPEAPLVDVVWQ